MLAKSMVGFYWVNGGYYTPKNLRVSTRVESGRLYELVNFFSLFFSTEDEILYPKSADGFYWVNGGYCEESAILRNYILNVGSRHTSAPYELWAAYEQ